MASSFQCLELRGPNPSHLLGEVCVAPRGRSYPRGGISFLKDVSLEETVCVVFLCPIFLGQGTIPGAELTSPCSSHPTWELRLQSHREHFPTGSFPARPHHGEKLRFQNPFVSYFIIFFRG